MTIMHDLKVKGYASYDKLKTCLVGRSYNRNQFSHIKNRKVKDILFKSKFDYENQPINRLKKVEIIENKQELLKKLKLKIENLKDCELKNNANKIVFSDGNEESSVMIIGEGPGQKEDELGKPFVGDAGAVSYTHLTLPTICSV